MTKLTAADVLALKALRREGVALKVLAQRFDVSRAYANRVCLGRERRGIGPPVQRVGRLTPEAVRVIRATHGVSPQELARTYGVSRMQIRRIQQGKAWASVQ